MRFKALIEQLERERDDAPGPDGESSFDPAGAPIAPGTTDPVLCQLVYGILLCDTDTALAHSAVGRLTSEVVDLNELRVCTRDELASMLGARFPRSAERADRLHAALNDIYLREHALRLDHLAEKTKREAKGYLESVEGVTHFAASRTLLLELQVHTFPIDTRITALLVASNIVPKGLAPQTIANRVERLVRAGEARGAYLLTEQWCQRNAASLRKSRPRASTVHATPRRSPAPSSSKADPK